MKAKKTPERSIHYTAEFGGALLENMVLTAIVMGLVVVVMQLGASFETHLKSTSNALLQGELCDPLIEPGKCDSSSDLRDPAKRPAARSASARGGAFL